MKAEDIRTISVIGAGFMGCGIAQVFASKNYNVHLYNRPHPEDVKMSFCRKELRISGQPCLQWPERELAWRVKSRRP